MKKFGLVVIGAHIGVHILPEIEKYKNEKILLVEPVPHNLRILKANIPNYDSIKIEPITIGRENKLRKFYFIKEESVTSLGKHWASGIGSFSKEHLLNHKSKRFNIQDEDIENFEVDFITFETLIENYQIKSIKKLQIDVEGAEYEILNSIDFKKININEIQFEFKHFDGTFTEGPKLLSIEEKLKSNGYSLSKIDNENMVAKK